MYIQYKIIFITHILCSYLMTCGTVDFVTVLTRVYSI